MKQNIKNLEKQVKIKGKKKCTTKAIKNKTWEYSYKFIVDVVS